MEFKKVYDTFSAMVNAAEILERIENEFGPSEQTIIANQKQHKRDKDQQDKNRQQQKKRAQERLVEQQRKQEQYKLTFGPKLKKRKKSNLPIYLTLLAAIVFVTMSYR